MVKVLKNEHRRFREARFGMLIHFGLYSAMGRGEKVPFKRME